MQPGEVWSETYLVAEWWPLKNNPELGPAKVPIHRVTKILNYDAGDVKYPLQEYREAHEMLLSLKAVDKERLEYYGGSASRETDQPPPQVPDDPNQLGVGTGSESETEKIDEALDWLQNPPEGAKEDRRGQGETLITGQKVRKYKGSRRPPGIEPYVWARLLTTKERKELIDEYETYLKGLREASRAGEPADIVVDPVGGPVVLGEGAASASAAAARTKQGRGRAIRETEQPSSSSRGKVVVINGSEKVPDLARATKGAVVILSLTGSVYPDEDGTAVRERIPMTIPSNTERTICPG